MKNIPQALLNKLLDVAQVKSNDSAPSLRVIATQSTANTLLGETIHDNRPSAFGDIAIRELVGESEPSRAYAVCVDSGIAKVYERHFPADWDNPWQYVFTLGAAKDVAIEFNGNWMLDAKSQWYILKTQETPLLFWVGLDDILYCQEWDNVGTKITLDTNVSNISVCRGWRNSLIAGLDQGLIVGYLKAGKVYYRAFCYQDTGEVIWEPAHEIVELGTGNTSISVFRTNDFRIGFLVENAGQMKWTLTNRNYAGMSFRPETANAQVRDVVCLIEDTRNLYVSNKGTDSAGVILDDLWFLQFPTTAPTLTVTSCEKINVDSKHASGFRLFLNLPISGVPSDYASFVTITPAMSVSSATYDSNLQAIILNVASNYLRSIDVNISILASRGGYYYKHPMQKNPLEVLSGFVAREITNLYGYAGTDAASVSGGSPTLILVNAVFQNTLESEMATVTIPSVTLILVPVSSLPI